MQSLRASAVGIVVLMAFARPPALRAQESVPGPFYEYETIARPDEDLLEILSLPAINDSGQVAFSGAATVTIPYDETGRALFLVDSAGSRSAVTRRAFHDLAGNVTLDNDGRLLAFSGGSIHQASRLLIHGREMTLWSEGASAGGYVGMQAAGLWSSDDLDGEDWYFDGLGAWQAMNNRGQNAFIAADGGTTVPAGGARSPSEVSASQLLLVTTQGADFRGGFHQAVLQSGVALDRLDEIAPMLADDGRVVVRAGLEPDAPIRAFEYDLADDRAVASAATGFVRLGRRPAISDTGKAVAYFGNRGDGPGLFLALDEGLGFPEGAPPIRVLGENLSRPRPELGYGNTLRVFPDPGFQYEFDPLHFDALDVDGRLGLVHIARGREGLADDSVVIAFKGQPSARSRPNRQVDGQDLLFSGEEGLWTVRVDFEVHPTTGALVPRPRSALPVVQVGDLLHGARVHDVAIFDPIVVAAVDRDGTPRTHLGRGDHRLAFLAETSAGAVIVRASHLDTDDDGLLDHWETTGIDMDGDGAVDLDLARLGADPEQKDVFLEIDWVAPRVRGSTEPWENRLQPGVTRRLVDTFARAGVTNPNGSRGIVLHVDAGPGTDTYTGQPLSLNMHAEMLQGGDVVHPPGLPRRHIEVVHLADFASTLLGVQDDTFRSLKNRYFGTRDKRARELAFHYAVLTDFLGYHEGSDGYPFLSSVQEATATTVLATSDLSDDYLNSAVIVTDGAAVGHLREITAIEGRELTVDPPWTIVPPAASTLAFLDGDGGVAEVALLGDETTLPGNDFVMSLGTFGVSNGVLGSRSDQWRTLLHELGHNLGLRHCGIDTDSTACDDVLGGLSAILTEPMIVAEGGVIASYQIVLDARPSAPVSVEISDGYGQVEAHPSAVTFTPGDWSTPRRIEVRAVDDAVVDEQWILGPHVGEEVYHAGALRHTLTSTDLRFHGAPAPEVPVVVHDSEQPGLVVLRVPDDSLEVVEGGAGDSYRIALSQRPVADVEVALGPSPPLQTSVGSLVFTPADWNVPQEVFLSAPDDHAPNRGPYDVIHTFSGDPAYASVGVLVSVRVYDRDSPAFLIQHAGGATVVAEGGASDEFSVSLAMAPTADVTVEVQSDGETSVAPSRLTFTSTSWSTPQRVTVAAEDDARVAEGWHSAQVDLVASSAHAAYDGLSTSVAVAVQDNDFELEPDHRSVMSYAHDLETDPVVSYTGDGDPLVAEWPNLKLDFQSVFTHVGATPEDFAPELDISLRRYIELFGRRPDVAGPEVRVLGLSGTAPLGGGLELRIGARDAVTHVARVAVLVDVDGDGEAAPAERVEAVPIAPYVYSARVPALGGAAGARPLRVSAEDLAGNERVVEVDLSVVPQSENRPPVASDRTVTTDAGTAVAVLLTGGDPEGNPVTYQVLTPPAHGDLAGTPPQLVYTPAPGFTGFDALSFRANDGLAYSEAATVTIMVGAVNAAPVLAAVASPVVDEDTRLEVALSASDADGDAITLSASGLPSFAAFTDRGDGTGTLALAPRASDVGLHRGIEIRASDGRFTSRVVLSVTVRAVNLAPVLAPIGDLRAYEGFSVRYPVSASDADGDALTFAAAGLPAFATLLDNGDGTGTLTLAPVRFRDDGVYPGVAITASDGDLFASETLTITVPGDTGPPEVGRVFPGDGARYLAGLQFIDLAFTESLQEAALTDAAFDLRDGAGARQPITTFTQRRSSILVTLGFAPLPAGSYTLTVDGTSVRDLEGNAMSAGPVVVTRFELVTRPDSVRSLFPDRTFRTARGPQELAAADFDEDGRLDLVASTLNGRFSLLLGNGDGTFREPTDVAGSNEDVAVGDVNGDGHADLVTASGTTSLGVITAHLGVGDGSFAAPRMTPVSFSSPASAVASGDLDGDGRDDVVVGAGNRLWLATSNGDGTFTVRDLRAVSARDVALADLNGDGRLDVVTDEVVALGNGDGTLASTVSLAVGTGGVVSLADVDGDGDRDVVITKPTATLHVVLGNGDGSFAPPLAQALPDDRPGASGLADLDGDGHLDLVVATGLTLDDRFHALPGRGDGTFGPAATYLTAPGTHLGLVLADFDGDADADVAHTSSAAASVAVHRNEAGTFAVSPDYGAGLDPSYAAVGDVDGDGRLDLVVANRDVFAAAGSVTLYLGAGDGTFSSRTDLTVDRAPHFVALVDVDEDGDRDLLTANGIGSVTVRLGNGDGSFAPGTDYAVGGRAVGLAHGDLDRDGDLDLAAAVPGTNSLAVLLGTGDGTFTPGLGVGSTQVFSSVALGDVDGDGHLDAAVKLETRPFPSFVPFVGVFRGRGDGTFDPTLVRHDVRTEGGEVRLADLDADGHLDIATSSRNAISHDGEHVITVLLGQGDGSFPTRADHLVGSRPVGLAVGRVDDDGVLDLVSANLDEDSVTVLLGDGTGGFGRATAYDVGPLPASVALGDLDGDGRLDFVTANGGRDAVRTPGSASPRLQIGATSIGVPTADAGPDRSAAAHTHVLLDGTGSSAGRPGVALGYRWVQRAGPETALTGDTTATPSFRPEAIGTYTFELTVTADALSATDSVAVAVTGQPDLSIAISDGVESVAPGGELTYTLRITNAGNVAAGGALVTATLPAHVAFVAAGDGGSEAGGSVSWPAFTLARGAEATRTLTVRAAAVWPAGVEALTVAAAVADGGGPDPTPEDDHAADTNAVDAAPDVAVALSDGRDQALPGETLAYLVTVRNGGAQGATGVAVEAALPARSALVSASDGGSVSDGRVTWPVFALAAGDMTTRTFAVELDPSWPAGLDAIEAAATAGDDDSNGPDPRPADNVATDVDAVRLPDLRVAIEDGTAAVVPGQTVEYTIVVTNAGPAPATGVLLSDTLPEWTDLVSASDGGASSDGRVVWPPFDLAAGAHATRSLVVRVRDVVPAEVGAIVNTAKAGDDLSHGPDPVPDDNLALDRNHLRRVADLRVAQAAAPEPVAVGSELAYTIGVANLGPARDGNVSLSVALPPDAELVSATATRGTCTTATPLVCLLGALEPGDGGTISLRVTPTRVGSLVATSTVHGAGLDAEGGNDVTRTTTTVLETVDTWAFSDATSRSGLGTPGVEGGGVAWCDFDHDGALDVIANAGSPAVPASRLYLNNGDGTFRDATASHAAGLLGPLTHRGAVCGDLDGDGDVDFARSTAAGIEIYRNGGLSVAPPFSFGDAAQTLVGPDTDGLGLVDFDRDGDLDLVADAEDRGLALFANDGTGRFTAETPRGLPTASTSGDFLAVGDYDADGLLDVLGRKQGAPDLWRGRADATFEAVPSFDEEASAANPGGVAFCDFDADGDFDLVWTDAGLTQIWRNRSGVFEVTGEPSASAGVDLGTENIDGVACGDVDLDGDVDLFLGSASGPSHLFLNRTTPGTDAPLAFVRDNRGIDIQADSAALAFADYDRDGDLDVLVGVHGGPNQLWENHRNDDADHAYLAVRALRCTAGSYRDDIGATLRLFEADGVTPLGPAMEVNGGRGHGSQDPAFVHFGLPPGPDRSYVVEVRFVGGPTVRQAVVPGALSGYRLVDVKSCGEGNRPPVAHDLSYEVASAPVAITLLASDPEGRPLSFEIVAGPTRGGLTGSGPTRVYTPPPGFTGEDSFTYRATDGELGSNVAAVRLLGPPPPALAAFEEVAGTVGLATPGQKEGGLAFCDFDEDGDLDALVNARDRSHLYVNRDGRFVDVTASHAPALARRALPRSAVCADVDNDGRLDFARNAHDRIEIYLNRGPRATPPWSFGKAHHGAPDRVIAHVPHGMSAEGLGLLDYDADGDLDLVFDNGRFGMALYENNGSGHFHPSTTRHGSRGLPQEAESGDYLAVADYDADGNVDLLARKGGELDLWRNEGARRFRAEPSLAAEAEEENKGGVAFCDFDADGDLDAFWTDADRSQIWRQDGGTFYATDEPSRSSGVPLSAQRLNGVACADVDHDGDVDLFLSAAAGPSRLFLNDTAPGPDTPLRFRLADAGARAFAPGEGAAFGDYDADGDMDLLVNVDGGNELWANGTGGRDSLMVRVLRCLDRNDGRGHGDGDDDGGRHGEGDHHGRGHSGGDGCREGDERHRDDVGATVRLFDADGVTPRSPLQEVSGGSGHGSQGPLLVHFGLPLGPDRVYVVEVRTVGGTVVRRAVRPSRLGVPHRLTIETCPGSRRGHHPGQYGSSWAPTEGPVGAVRRSP